MDLPAELQLIHQPVRLKIMGLLYKHGDVGFTEARELLGLTPGNLDAHTKKLADAGLLASRRALARDHFEVRLSVTTLGISLFDQYLAKLEAFLSSVSP